jgi:hypothetical protein
MAFTQDDLDVLNASIAQGALKVKYADKEVEYRSLKDMLELRRLMAAELGLLPDPDTNRKYAEFNKGFTP